MAEARNPSENAVPLYQQPCLRSDLRIVYGEPGADGDIRIVDPRSGRQYAFDAREHILCEAADGTADLPAIQARAAAAAESDPNTGKAAPMTLAEVTDFFRRLHILGLLAPEGTMILKAVPPAPDARSRRRGEGMGGQGIGGPGMGGGRNTRRLPPKAAPQAVPQTVPSVPVAAPDPVAVRPAEPAPPAEIAAEIAPDIASDIAVDPVAAPVSEGVSEAEAEAEPVPGPAARRQGSVLRMRSGRGFGRQTADTDAKTAAPKVGVNKAGPPQGAAPEMPVPEMPVAETPDLETSIPETPLPETPAPETAAPETPVPAPLPVLTTPAKGGRKDAADVPAINFFDDEFGDAGGAMGGMGAGMGGGMRAGMGGMRGMRGGMGAGMGGGMGAAMGAGPMGGGMGGPMGGGDNRERFMAAMAGRRGMGGGMAAGAMGGQGAADTGEKKPAQLPLFNPQGLLRLLYILFYPLKFVLWAIVPLTVIASLSMLNNLPAVAQDFRTITSDFSAITLFLISMIMAHLVPRIVQSVAVVAYGGKVSTFGLTLIFGVMPRFYFDKKGIAELDRKGQLWAYGSALLARLALFAGGTLIWAVTRETGGTLPMVALITAQAALVMFIITSWPLLPLDGLHWISALFNQPRLMAKAAMSLKYAFFGGRLPPIVEKRDAMPLAFFAVGVILTSIALIGFIGIGALIWLEAELGGMGVIFFLGFFASFLIWLLATWGAMRARTGGRRGGQAAAFDQEGFRQMAMGATSADADADAAIAPQSSLQGRAKVIWALLLVLLLAVAFRPYNYEAGGQVEILPTARSQAVARTDGEILQIMVAEGDIVTQGQTLAQLSSWNQENDVSVTQALLTGAEAKLAELVAGPKPEEIELARRQLASAESSVAYSQAEADRARELVATGAVSQQNFEKANSTYQTDLANLDVARAALALAESGSTDEQIQIAQAEVSQLEQEVSFRQDELERTRIVAPMDGRVVTADLELRHGSFLRVGEAFLEIENVDVVNAEISVPESDIGLIDVGAVVRFKAWGQSEREVDGIVESIAPAATGETYGNVVRVVAVFQNPDGILRSGMTGYAKIEGGEMRVWEAYMRSIRRFFQVEVWSWIP